MCEAGIYNVCKFDLNGNFLKSHNSFPENFLKIDVELNLNHKIIFFFVAISKRFPCIPKIYNNKNIIRKED